MLLGPYAGSVLRFTLTFPLSFPRARPAVHFETDVFHRESSVRGPFGSCVSWADIEGVEALPWFFAFRGAGHRGVWKPRRVERPSVIRLTLGRDVSHPSTWLTDTINPAIVTGDCPGDGRGAV